MTENSKESLPVTLSVKVGPKDFFLHLLAIVSLYSSAIAFLVLVFQFVNVLLPDVLNQGEFYRRSGSYPAIRGSMATLIVLFPVYVFTTRFLNKTYKEEPEKKNLKVRKWLIYFTLFAAALILIGDLVTLIYNFLQGELTLRFVLKVLAVGFVAGSVFYYYFWDLRASFPKRAKIFISGVIFVVAVSVVAGFIVAGSPNEERLRRLDDRRVGDLQNIQWQVVSYYQSKEKLPASLSELADPLRGFTVPNDPETGADYVYKVDGELSFSLCATFSAPSEKSPVYSRAKAPVPYPESSGISENWEHGAGETCFSRTIDKDFYPPTKPIR